MVGWLQICVPANKNPRSRDPDLNSSLNELFILTCPFRNSIPILR
jgi:hypothetical protein